MSLALNTTTPEGIVLSADSRQSYRNRKGMARIGSDTASKLFQLNKRIGVAVTGLAFLPEDNVPKNISKFIEQFKRETDVEKLDVKDAAQKMHYLFNKKLEKIYKDKVARS
jgi:20S proteasome alpha/beta subunit